LQSAENIAQQTNLISLIDDTVLNRIMLWLRQGQVETTANWVQRRGLSLDKQSPESFENSILIRLSIAQSQAGNNTPLYDEIMALLNKRCKITQTSGLNWELIRNLILLSLAYQTQGDEQKALDALKQALILAQPLGLIRTFVDEGPAMAALLRKSAASDIVSDYATKLLAAIEDDDTVPPISRLEQASSGVLPFVDPLRQREIEVLRHIALGRSNKEIAEEMIIGVSTVKWHLRNVYEKLQVHRRTQALARAKELDLL
jgi:LuxR family maltose regulon positive regulatory protein